MVDARPSPDPARQRLPWRLGLRLGLAWALEWAFRLGRALAGFGVVLAAFLTLLLFDLPALLPLWLHVLLVLAALAAMATALRQGFKGFRAPARRDARRRLEAFSGRPHRPLTGLEDRPATDLSDSASRALWHAHRARLAREARELRLRLGNAERERRTTAMLGAMGAALVIAFIAAGPQSGERLWRGLAPLPWIETPPVSLQVWITPPEYTGRAPVLLDLAKAGSETAVPEGSTVLGLVHGGRGTPRLILPSREKAFERLAEGDWRVETRLEDGGALEVRQGRSGIARWAVSVIEDQPPSVRFTAPPAALDMGRLRLSFEAVDDYGVESVAAVIRRTGLPEDADPLVLDLAAPDTRSVRATVRRDLAAHPWAGQEAAIHLRARDAKVQEGTSETIAITLPERAFTHPVAREIIALRRTLIDRPESARRQVTEGLDELSLRPERFDHRLGVFLSLRTARARLTHDRTGEAAAGSVRDLLWHTALAVEDGALAGARQTLAEAEENLARALADGADEAELERLTQALAEALDRYLAELVRKLPPPSLLEGLPLAEGLDIMDLGEMRTLMERLRDMVRSGSMEGASSLMERLRERLEALRAMRPDGGAAETLSQARALMERLQNLTRRQQELLDSTHGLDRSVFGPDAPTVDAFEDRARELGETQRALRSELAELLRPLGELTPDTLRDAGREMEQAEEHLSLGETGRALPPQARALEKLRDGARQAVQQMVQPLAGLGMGGMMPGMGGRDPLGRPIGPIWDDGTTRIPDESETQRTQEIIEELRRRAADPERPRFEREYIERLLRRF